MIYDAFNEVAKNGDIIPVTDLDKNVAELFLFDFEQCGIHLSEEERREVVGLNDRILQVSTYYILFFKIQTFFTCSVVRNLQLVLWNPEL